MFLSLIVTSSFINDFIYSFPHCFIYVIIHSFPHLRIIIFIHSVISSFIHDSLVIHSVIYSSIHSFHDSLVIHSFIYLIMFSFISYSIHRFRCKRGRSTPGNHSKHRAFSSRQEAKPEHAIRAQLWSGKQAQAALLHERNLFECS